MECTKQIVQVFSDNDYIHDVSHNYYGDRLAVCTSAQSILVYEVDSIRSKLKQTIVNAHNGPIWRVDWAHPEFGHVIASCSEDRTIAIWLEKESIGENSLWRRKALLTDSGSAVVDVQFAPRSWGMKLASCSSDGTVRVYYAPDILNISYWEVEDIHKQSKTACTALSWCSTEDFERLSVTYDDGTVSVFEKNSAWQLKSSLSLGCSSARDCAWAPNLCRPIEWLACCGEDGIAYILSFHEGKLELSYRIHVAKTPLWRVSWNMTATTLAVAPESGVLQLWRLNAKRNSWEKLDM